jgi:hypothetical protein
MNETIARSPGTAAAGTRPGATRLIAWGLAALALPGLLAAQPTVRLPGAPAERTVSREQITLELVRIEGQLQSWVMRKVCLDGQVYWLGFSETAPTAMAPSFRDGKPEQCSGRTR